ncbi:hypothetical protein J4E85_005751 [Alternaria conjuncta]|uniref:uncharacterized protein n=1 Tax=Alternaria conjuncta TaxID=181017 RepID=UPI0022206378|nr:uncharacterized protein J4E85_005751 [Alternaria conjuncta]KAI4929126.1 hypothetical protein J4E85_005751 [Alternaria conjuncta]
MADPLPKDTGARAPASELVNDTKLDTVFKKDYTIHLIDRKKHKWKANQELGQGAFGVVWLEKLVGGGDGDVRAVKKINKEDAKNYNRELHAIAKFSKDRFNTWFVKSFGWYENDEHVFISMEYLPHGDLGCYLDKSGPLPELEVQQIACQILEGLECMHKDEFIHRDLKPQNVLIKETGPRWWIKLGDFGISKRMDNAELHHTVTGTPAFMAPEMLAYGGKLHSETFADSKPYTNAVDIWALGALVFMALTGVRPFAKDLLSYVNYKTPFPKDLLQKCDVSQPGCDFIERLLAVIPEDRLTASGALHDTWLAEQRAESLAASLESLEYITALSI